MNWDETIKYIQNTPSYERLIRDSYLEENLVENVKRFEDSPEFLETIDIIQKKCPEGLSLLDIGSGNGISAIAFARKGYQVTALEPDSSDVAGIGAINQIIDELAIENVVVHQSTLEQNKIKSNSFDIVYARQAMHHANDLNAFVLQASRLLKPRGVMFTSRDHVIFNNRDKERFLSNHPLQKYYGGENAFTPLEYREAFEGSGLEIIEELKFFDSIINYYPLTEAEINERETKVLEARRKTLEKQIGLLSRLPFAYNIYNQYLNFKVGSWKGEQSYPGRMYSYICLKPESNA
jgi:SAM-dependent methyltransferase